jgi:trimethylamine--corrinoid protein Co-methyltransferase
MAGSTGPVSLAGALSLQNAEVLAGICLAQSIRSGAPVVYGSTSALAYMQSASLSIGNPECAIFTSASAQLARYYGIPSRGGGGLTDAKELDAQAGYESMMTLFAASLSGINFVLHAAGILQNFMAMSYEKFVMDEEIGAMILHYLKGMDMGAEEKFAYDAIKKVGPGGEFLTSEHTRTYFKSESFFPRISDRRPFDLWANPYVSIEERARAKWQSTLANYTPPELDAAKKEELEAFVAKREKELGVA